MFENGFGFSALFNSLNLVSISLTKTEPLWKIYFPEPKLFFNSLPIRILEAIQSSVNSFAILGSCVSISKDEL